MKILCIGHAAYDITIPVDSFIEENSKNRVSKRLENGGGPACTAAYLLGKWGMDVTFIGILGNDLYGEKIVEELKSVNVETKFIQRDSNYKTTSSFIINNKENGSRTILTYRPDEFKMSDVELDFNPDIILIDGQEIELSKSIINKYPKAISIIDAGRATDNIIELSKVVDHLVCSKDFAMKVSGIEIDTDKPETLVTCFHKLETMFKSNIVVTLEDKGCLYKKDGKIKIMPSLKVDAIDSTGAGDIFHGAFTFGLAREYDLETILKISNIAGAVSVKYLGSRNSIRTLEEMREYNEFFK